MPPRRTGECPPGKIRNPSTSRCVDAKGPTGRRIRAARGNVMTPCPAGTVRNAATGRCVRAVPVPASGAERRCPTGTVMNPTTRRCVKATGAIGRRLLAAAAVNATPPYMTAASATPAAPAAPSRPSRPSPGPSTPSLANLNAKCSNDSDPVMMTDFKNMNRNELRSIVAIGSGRKKHCYLLDTIFGVYKTAVMDNQPVKDPLDPSYILTNAEIGMIDRMMLKRDPSYRPPKRTKMNYKGYELDISPDGNYFRLRIVRRGRMAMDLGYIPGNIEASDTGSTDTTSATMIAALRELWDQRRMLRSAEPLRVVGTIHLRKTKDFWRGADRLNKFRELMAEIQRFRGSYV